MIKQSLREITTCVCCGVEGPRAARNLIRSCYMRHYKAGTLDQFARERGVDSRPGRVEECACCGAEGPIKARGLTYDCYQRHRWAGTLEQFPPTGVRHATRREQHAVRREEYAFLRSCGEAPEKALKRVGLKGAKATIARYEVAR